MNSKLSVSRDEEKICLLSNYLDRQTDIEEIRKIRNYDRQTGLPTDRKTNMRVHKEVPLPIRNVSRKITQPR